MDYVAVEKTNASRLVLPAFTLTETCEGTDPDAIHREFRGVSTPQASYYYKAVRESIVRTQYREVYQWNQYPVVLSADGSPWAEANLFLLDMIESVRNPNMTTFCGKALDLVNFRQFLDSRQIDFLVFPKRRRIKPTYAYLYELQTQVDLGEISVTTAKGRISTLKHFYSWMISESICKPEYPPWEAKTHNILYKDKKGFSQMKEVPTSDLKIKGSTASNSIQLAMNDAEELKPVIIDSGKLRPLELNEQETLVESLNELKNTTMTLIHFMGLFTGARIQTILTMRVRHARLLLPENVETVPLQVGPRTGIDTKGDKNFRVFIPRWLYEKLRIYSYSPVANTRRDRSGLNSDDQYLFLTRDGNPMYISKSDMVAFDPEDIKRYFKQGSNVRQFIARRIIPLAQKKLGRQGWSYQFHDLRASYGMNQLETQITLVAEGKISLTEALRTVQGLMAHESLTTTECYLKYRQDLEQIRHLQNQYEEYLKSLTEKAMAGDL